MSVISRVIACALVLAACGGAAAPPTPRPPSPSPIARTTAPSPTIGFDEMMGGAPAATVFVVSGSEVLAVTLLNHFVRYRIPVSADAQLAVSPDGARLYIADVDAGTLRLRWFDVTSGTERASRHEPSGGTAVGAGTRGAVAVGPAGELLLLRTDALARWIDAFDGWTLSHKQRVANVPACAEKLLVSEKRIAAACLTSGWQFLLIERDGARSTVNLPGSLVAAAMLLDGTIFVARPKGDGLFRIRAGERYGEDVFGSEIGPVLPDAIAAADEWRIAVATPGRTAKLQVVDRVLERLTGTFDLPNTPANGILASGQFAYWVDAEGTGVYHVDLQSGLVERMYGPLGKGALLGALAPR